MSYNEITAPQISAVIGDFVQRHSAYRDFEYAYGMLVGVLTRPVPRSAEAIVWNNTRVNVRMPMPFCVRGVSPELYSGTPYASGPDWQDTFTSWMNAPMAGVCHSVAMMEAVYTELFHLTRIHQRDEVDRENFMNYATGLSDCPNTGIMVDMALACMRYGREYTFRYTTSCGVDRLATIPSLLAQPQQVTIVDARATSSYDLGPVTAGTAPLNISAFAPVTFPSLSYGVNEDKYYMNADRLELKTQHRTRDGLLTFSDPEEFSQYMTMMRLFGYDVVATSSFENRRIHNWSDNASGRFIYVHDTRDVAPRFVIAAADIRKRPNHWIELPTLYGEVTYGYELGKKALTWFSGPERIGFASAPVITVNRAAYQKAISTMLRDRPTVTIVPLQRRSDFYSTVISAPPSRPALAPSSLEMASGQPIRAGVGDAPDAPPTAE